MCLDILRISINTGSITWVNEIANTFYFVCTKLSIFSFVGGDYKNYNMTEFNLTIVRDYVFYLALKSAGQGIGEEVSINSSIFIAIKTKINHVINGQKQLLLHKT
jgi:hypothetical protein